MNKLDLDVLHKHSINNRPEILQSAKCGCFYCGSIFQPQDIEDWIQDTDETAVCPSCGIDSVLGDVCGVEITEDVLTEMYERWFC